MKKKEEERRRKLEEEGVEDHKEVTGTERP
jgi:hypothetical protein